MFLLDKEDEETTLKNEDDIMTVIKNSSPGKKIAENESKEKSAKFSLFKPYNEEEEGNSLHQLYKLL